MAYVPPHKRGGAVASDAGARATLSYLVDPPRFGRGFVLTADSATASSTSATAVATPGTSSLFVEVIEAATRPEFTLELIVTAKNEWREFQLQGWQDDGRTYAKYCKSTPPSTGNGGNWKSKGSVAGVVVTADGRGQFLCAPGVGRALALCHEFTFEPPAPGTPAGGALLCVRVHWRGSVKVVEGPRALR